MSEATDQIKFINENTTDAFVALARAQFGLDHSSFESPALEAVQGAMDDVAAQVGVINTAVAGAGGLKESTAALNDAISG